VRGERLPGWLGAVVPVGLLILWELAGRFALLPDYLPPPSAIGARMGEMLASRELLPHAWASLYRALGGFAIGALCGVAAGLLAGSVRPAERFFDPLISFTYPVPKVAALPIVFAWFGLGDLSKIVMISVSVFFPVYIAALYGAKSTARMHLWGALCMGAGRGQLFRKVVLPSALPQIFNGLRVGLALSFIIMVVTELVVSHHGLGYLIGFAGDALRFDIMYAAIVAIGVIGFAADRLLLAVRRKVLAGQLLATEAGR
jgi:ABC-type nitrate/sulfonate/bicarbonate transport system permease component